MKLNRRQVLTYSSFAAVGALGLGFRASELSTSDIRLEERRVELNNLPPAFQDYRIGFLSDPHLGVFVPTEWVERGISLLQQAGVDLLLLGGDFIWLPDRDMIESHYPIRNPRFLRPSDKETAALIFETLADVAGRLKPKDGSFAVLGNHDNWTDPKACVQRFATHGIRTLLNELVVIKRGSAALHLVGVQDYWTGIPKIPTLPEAKPQTALRILMTHNPDFTSELLREPQVSFDLALSGHTHAGQVKLPLIGAIHYNIEDLRFREGFYIDRGLTSYTSRGLGVVEMPFRLNCPAEVTVFTLKQT